MCHRLGFVLALLVLAAGCCGETGPSAAETKVAADTKAAADKTPGERKPAAPAHGDTLIEASIGNVSSLIPTITSDNASHEVGALMYNGLVTLGRDMELLPELATSWNFSKDCLTLDFKLRQGVKWHDGAPFTAADVVFTYETTVHPKTPSPYKSDFNDVEKVEALDPSTVRV